MRPTGLAAVAVAAALSAPVQASYMPPIATATASTPDFSSDGWTPKPTPPAGGLSLLRRQLEDDDEGTTALIAPDNTCGFVSARPGAVFSCGLGYNCVFFTATSVYTGYVGCCNSITCGVRLDCIDYESYYSSSACTDGCEVDAFTLKCTNSAMPYCNTVSFSSDIYDFWCNSLDNSVVQFATTAYSGSDRTFSELALTNPTSSESSSERPSPTGPDDVDDVDETDDEDNDNNNDDEDNNDNDNGGSSTPVGPIVGGVVGGVGGIAVVGLAIWLFLRHRRKSAAAASASAPPPGPPPAMAAAGMAPGQPPYDPRQSHYDPKFAAATAQQPVYAHQQPQQPGGFYPMGNTPPPGAPGTGTSPTMSYTDPNSPTATYPSGFSQQHPSPPLSQQQQQQQQQGGYVYEAPSRPDETHRGGVHELG